MKEKELVFFANYESPEVEVIEIEVEQGFAASYDIDPYEDGTGWN